MEETSEGDERYGVSLLGTLREHLGGMQGIQVVAKELIQNADDAKDEHGRFAASVISFDVGEHALLVRNDGTFQQKDFENIKTVMNGGKRKEAGEPTTGEKGIGFISVYNITDRPELRSAGQHRVFEPAEERVRVRPDEESESGTIFRFPWAKNDTKVRQELGRPPITTKEIQHFARDLQDALPTLVLFLKSLRRIELLEKGIHLCSAEKTTDGMHLEIRTQNSTERWLILGEQAAGLRPIRQRHARLTARERETWVGLAVSLDHENTGFLFATLPTERLTGLPFHINGSFYTEIDRRNILEHGYELEWNREIVASAAKIFRKHLPFVVKNLQTDRKRLWSMLNRVYIAHQQHSRDNGKLPISEFWTQARDELNTLEVIYDRGGHWRRPGDVILVERGEDDVADVLEVLNEHIVHQDLIQYHNALLALEVKTPNISRLVKALKRRGIRDKPVRRDLLPKALQSDADITRLWNAIMALLPQRPPATPSTPTNPIGVEESKGAPHAQKPLQELAIAPCTDGKLWPLSQAFRSKKEAIDLFNSLKPDMAFLVPSFASKPLARRLCPRFTVKSAMAILEQTDEQDLLLLRKRGEFQPKNFIKYFYDNRQAFEADPQLRTRFGKLLIFPTVGKLRPLEKLALPGNFTDPLGLDVLINMKELGPFHEFLKEMGAEVLDLAAYLEIHVPDELRRRKSELVPNVVQLLSDNVEVFDKNPRLKEIYSQFPLIECADGSFARPDDLYFDTPKVRRILGSSAQYAKSSADDKQLRNLYERLGVHKRARPTDVVRRVRQLVHDAPAGERRREIEEIITEIGVDWKSLPARERQEYKTLATFAWLPSENSTTWHKASQLAAAEQRSLFESQVYFLDLPQKTQSSAKGFLEAIGVQYGPKPEQVAAHLLKCAEADRSPPAGIYGWLERNATAQDIASLRARPCLIIEERYYRPNQVYRTRNPFGRYRPELAPEMTKRYPRLLEMLDVPNTPTFEDTVEVIQEISEAVGASPIGKEDSGPLVGCWRQLEYFLEDDQVTPEELADKLSKTNCIPNDDRLLKPPSEVFFDDGYELADKFNEILEGNAIRPPEPGGKAMKAAGVRRLSEVTQSKLVGHPNGQIDENLATRIASRIPHIRRLCSSAADETESLRSITEIPHLRYIRVDRLQISWHLRTESLDIESKPEPRSAHLHREQRTVRFVKNGLEPPWDAIAHELARTLTPRDVPKTAISLTHLIKNEDENSIATMLDKVGAPPLPTPLAAETDRYIPDRFGEEPEAEPTPEERATPMDRNVSDETPIPTSAPSTPEPPEDSPSFAEKLMDDMSGKPIGDPDLLVSFPAGGPLTRDSATKDTARSRRFGRAGAKSSRKVRRWDPTPIAKDLEERFKELAQGDYGKRCQICGTTFRKRNGEPYVSIIHLLPPQSDHRTNHLGNLLSACGWHADLMKWGWRHFLDPESNDRVEDAEGLIELIDSIKPSVDEYGNDYWALPIRFQHVYANWSESPENPYSEIRYNKSHWVYLQELLKADGGKPIND